MRKLFIAGLLVAAASTAPAAASVLPYGVQNNITAADISGWGFTQCFSGNYYSGSDNIATALGGCQGGMLMMAAKQIGSNTFTVAAAGLRDDVLFDPGVSYANNSASRSATHNANGVEWYFSDSWSWGFAPGGSSVFRNSCDTGYGADTASQRLCWHTYGGNFDYGYSAGGNSEGSGGGNYERFLFAADVPSADVPEPAMLGLFGLGAIGLGLSRRRRA